ncbi:hypothetical protein WN944_003402 [Citrus x changshan-huyou]|uniref:Uncharacterized protein n=1 Tax=Citrus x changshan-huyou TaxID=2935761 RepID=A0AAP0M339_9ROSI
MTPASPLRFSLTLRVTLLFKDFQESYFYLKREDHEDRMTMKPPREYFKIP